MAELTYASHRRFHPLFHFVTIPILVINVLIQLWFAVHHPRVWVYWWSVIVTIAVVIVAVLARSYALRVQDRVIRLEETLRLTRVLPDDLRSRIDELSTGDLIGLRFAPDGELPEIVSAICSGDCKGREQVKQRIRGPWREDKLRI